MPLDEIRRQLVTAVRPHRHQLRGAFHQAQEMPVARVARVGEQPVAAGVDQQAAGQQQGAGTARSDQHALWVEVDPVAFAVEFRDRLAQRRQAAGGGVAGMPGGQGGAPGSTIGSAVVKSGSPISRWITSWPATCNSLARASRAMTWKGSMARLRAL